ncbi:hypothetical protein FI98_02686 [Mycobacterium tuberculosis]|nr:hypothetical protein FI98_02686 [Mycobacterium tuberculosis]
MSDETLLRAANTPAQLCGYGPSSVSSDMTRLTPIGVNLVMSDETLLGP